MITREQYYMLLEYSHVSSWAVWDDPEEGSVKSGTANVDMLDISNYSNDNELLSILNNDFVLVGLNAAVHSDTNIRKDPWNAFHSDDNKRQKDYKLRYALKGTPLWGSYITDALKGYPKTNSSQVVKDLKNREMKALLDKSIEDFRRELEILGDPIIVALGNASFKIVKKYFNEKYRIVKITHFSYFIGQEKYKERVHKELLSQGVFI